MKKPKARRPKPKACHGRLEVSAAQLAPVLAALGALFAVSKHSPKKGR